MNGIPTYVVKANDGFEYCIYLDRDYFPIGTKLSFPEMGTILICSNPVKIFQNVFKYKTGCSLNLSVGTKLEACTEQYSDILKNTKAYLIEVDRILDSIILDSDLAPSDIMSNRRYLK